MLDTNEFEKCKLAEDPKTPTDILEWLASDNAWIVRSEVAANPSTPVEVLRKLAKDEDGDVRAGVAMNESTPIEILKDFVERGIWPEIALDNPKITKEMCLEWSKTIESKYIKWKLHCLMLEDVFQSKYTFDKDGNIYMMIDDEGEGEDEDYQHAKWIERLT